MKTGIVIFMMLLSFTLLAQSNAKKEMKEEKVKIEIWSDVVCPFCFLGKKKVEQAISKLNAKDKVEVIWRSFQLDPDFSQKESLPSIQYLSERKRYPIEQIESMCIQLGTQGKSYGIDFDFDKSLTFNTLDVHRLIHWAQSFGLSSELKEAFMVAHFSEGLDLSKEANLYTVIKKVGLNLDDAKDILQSDTYSKSVEEDINKSKSLGIRGVPFFLINGKTTISGAQADQTFENVIAAALKDLKPEPVTTSKGVCVPNEDCK
ncbi:MAG: DsbA family oxidoreductase [Aureispira sp.]|nr:DsbA family oxidoreductase [Aureispira sp.]